MPGETPVRRPIYGNVSHFGDRASLFLAIALGASIVVHSSFALAAYVRELTVAPAQPTCRVGENLQIELYARTPWTTLRVTGSQEAKWHLSDDKVVSHAGGGFMRCTAEGTSTITTTYLNGTATFTLKVEPPLVMVDVKEEEPPPPPPPVAEPEPQPVAQAPQAAPEAKAAEPPPPAAKAGNLLTAPDDPKAGPDEPYSFVTNPDGEEYGSGSVAKNGTAEVGKPGAAASGVPGGTGKGGAQQGPPQQGGAAITPTTDLSRKPSLPAGYSCKNFPADADDDVANVQVLVTVKPSGEVQSVSVMDEKPKGQGFGKAARTCVSSVRLTPGLDKSGNPTLTTVAISVHFSR